MHRKLALALLAPLVVVACASEADEAEVDTDGTTTEASRPTGEAVSDGLAALRAVPDAAAEAGSGRFEMTMAMDTPDGTFEMLAAGGFDGTSMSMEMDLGAMLRDLADATGEVLPPGFEEPMQVVLDGETLYVRMPMLDLLTGTSGWLSASPEDLGQGGDALGLGGASTSPTALMETLRGVADDVEEVGSEEVRGVATTHYRATLDFDRVLEEVPSEQRDEIEAQLDQLGGSGVEALPIDVWVDDAGLARRLVLSLDSIDAGFGGTGSMTMTMELFDYGEPYDVVVPDPSEVTPLAEVMPGMDGTLG